MQGEENINFLKEFIGIDWLEKEFDKVEAKSPLKGAGTLLRHNFDKVIDKKDAQQKLRNPK